MRVHALGDGLQEGGFAVVAAAHDEGEARGDRHAGYLAGVGQGDGGAQGVGGGEGDDAVTGEGNLGHAGAAREHGLVGDEGHPAALLEDALEGAVVLVGGDVGEEAGTLAGGGRVFGDEVEAVHDDVGHVDVEEASGALAEDGTPARGELDLEADFDAVGQDGGVGALEDEGTGAGDRHVACAAGADGLVEGARDEVRGGEARVGRGQGGLGQSHGLGRGPGTQGRGRGVGIGLHVIDREGEVPVIPGTQGVLVEAVGTSIRVSQLVEEVCVSSGDGARGCFVSGSHTLKNTGGACGNGITVPTGSGV